MITALHYHKQRSIHAKKKQTTQKIQIFRDVELKWIEQWKEWGTLSME